MKHLKPNIQGTISSNISSSINSNSFALVKEAPNIALQSTWRIAAPNETVHLPLQTAGTYNFVVDWGDGTTSTITSYDQVEATHTYAEVGDYLVSCEGLLTVWESQLSATAGRLLSINNIGETGLITLNNFASGHALTLLESVVSVNSDTSAVNNFTFMMGYYAANTIVNIKGLDITGASYANYIASYSSTITDVTISGVTIGNSGSLRAMTPMSSNIQNITLDNFTIGTDVEISGMKSPALTNFSGDVFTANAVASVNRGFIGSTLLDLDISDWNVSALTDCTYLMYGTSFSTVNYDKMLIAWQAKPHMPNVPFHAGTAKYSPGAPSAAKASLEADGWTFTDGGLNGVVAKSVVFDMSDNWGSTVVLGLRSIEFSLGGSVIPLLSSDFTAYATSSANSNFLPEFAFDTSLSKVGAVTLVSWSATLFTHTNQRLIVVFNSEQTFDEIIINNSHLSGGSTDRSVKNVKITTSTDAITDVTYNAAIANSTVLNNTVWPEHVALDIADDQTVWAFV